MDLSLDEIILMKNKLSLEQKLEMSLDEIHEHKLKYNYKYRNKHVSLILNKHKLEQELDNYFIENMTKCYNCLSYGIIKKTLVIVPCLNCAKDPNIGGGKWMWNGKHNLGSLMNEEVSPEKLALITYSHIKRLRFNFERTERFQDISFIEYCLKQLPPISHKYFKLLIDSD